MKSYIGTKQVNAKSMTRQEYNDFRGWKLPADENGADDGYLVEYPNSPNANTEEYAGYISWLSKQQFEDAYRQCNGMSFGLALEVLKAGGKVAREGWNGKGMFILLNKGRIVENLEPNSFYEKSGFTAPIKICDHIDMKAADGSMVVGWLASQTDTLAEDWYQVA